MRLPRGTWTAVALCAVVLGVGRDARGDGGNEVTSTDEFARLRAKEYEELRRKGGVEAPPKRLEILRKLEFAPCNTARKFLLDLFRKSSTPGDERIGALDALCKMAEPSTLENVLATLAKERDPVLWQAFAETWPERPSKAVTDWAAGPGLASPPNEAVAACLEGFLRRPAGPAAEAVAALHAKHARPGGDPDLACRALRVLARAGPAEARAALLAAARNPEWRLRLTAAPYVAGMLAFDAECEAALRGLLADESEFVRQAAAANAGASKRASVAGALVGLLADPRPRTRRVASVALKAISGKDLGLDPKAWGAWLEQRDPGKPEDVTLATYHGFSLHTDRVLFLVDASSSMGWPWRKPVHRIDVARTELASTLRRLTPGTLFNVVVFSDSVSPWKKGEVAATAENVAAAVRWSEAALAKPAGDTHLYEALEAAFAANPAFDTIYLLTDGNPVAGRYWTTGALLAAVRAFTRYRPAAIHTIGLSLASEDPGLPNLTEDLGVMRSLLAALAAVTAGEFREVLTVPAPK